MPYFSDFEKQIIKRIVSRDNGNPEPLGELCGDILFKEGEMAVFVTIEPKDGILLANIHSQNSAKQKIIDLISIIDFLEKNRYIIRSARSDRVWGKLFYSGKLFDVWNSNPENVENAHFLIFKYYSNFIEKNTTLKFTTYSNAQNILAIHEIKLVKDNYFELVKVSLGHNLMDSMILALTSYFYPTTKLRNLINNGFESNEEKSAKKQICIAQYTLLLAVLTFMTQFIIDQIIPVIRVILKLFLVFIVL